MRMMASRVAMTRAEITTIRTRAAGNRLRYLSHRTHHEDSKG